VAARAARVPHVVHTIHGLLFHVGTPRWKQAAFWMPEKLSLTMAHVVFSQSREDVATAVRLRLCREDKIHWIGNGISTAAFAPDAAAREAMRARLGYRPGQVVVGFVGRLVHEKGIRELLAAAESLGAACPDVQFLLVGPREPERADCLSDEAMRRTQTSGRVKFAGLQDDMPPWYAAMDMLALPSYREGVPRCCLEAAATGIPIIATDIRGCREVVRHGITGLLVAPRDTAQLAAAIQDLATNPSRRRDMGLAAHALAQSEFDNRAVLARLTSCYGDLAPRKAAASVYSRFTKPAVDRLTAAIALLLLSPLIAIVATAVLCCLGRPVLFRQQRIGRGGCGFTLLKFRTMANARSPQGGVLPDAVRLTPLGRWLRAASLDELPQLWNVMRGEMSLIGPRPLLPEYLPRYTPEQTRRHEVKPGITGWAQVAGRNSLSWPAKFERDVWYVDNVRLGVDLRILLRTVRVVFSRAGISGNDHATMPPFLGAAESASVARSASGPQSDPA
jgi:lipopolysaccharide/colanic/teichoic acid biosynthesis glycosyltransferase